MAEYIKKNDFLNDGRVKINIALTEANDNANEAKSESSKALNKANQSLNQSHSTQNQLNQIMIEGDSSVEAAAARVDEKGQSHNSLKARIDDGFTRAADFNLFPQSPKPQKVGLLDNSFKLIKKTEDRLDVIQKTNKGYVHYTLEKNKGASGSGDYGAEHELIRLVDATHTIGAYVYYDLGTPHNGSVTEQWSDLVYGNLEQYLYGDANYDSDRMLNSQNASAKMYRIEANNTVTWRIPIGRSNKYNCLFLGTPGSSDNVDILINGSVVKNIDLSSFVSSTTGLATGLTVVDFEVPRRQPNANEETRGTVDIAIKNKGNKPVSVSSFNFFELSDYEGQPINQFKSIGTNKRWITGGANDYAIRDYNQNKLFGSYHGGETSESAQLFFNQAIYPLTINAEKNHHFQNIENNEWCVLEYFYIYQRTKLANSQAKMTSRFDFNSDGTIEMEFGYESESLMINSFRTAMSCTHPSFLYVTFPKYYRFRDTPTEEFYYIPTTEGKITQVNSVDGLQLDLRFTRFNQEFEESGVFIADRAAYRKLYYGPLDNSQPLLLKSLSFSKGMDFTVR